MNGIFWDMILGEKRNLIFTQVDTILRWLNKDEITLYKNRRRLASAGIQISSGGGTLSCHSVRSILGIGSSVGHQEIFKSVNHSSVPTTLHAISVCL